MNKFERRNQEEEERERKEQFNNELFLFTSSLDKATKIIEEYLGDVKTRTGIIPVFRTDHYISDSAPKDGIFQFSRYTAIISGIKISADTHQQLMKILGAIT